MSGTALPRLSALAIIATLLVGPPIAASERSIVLQTTASPANSGLYKVLLPKFTASTGIRVHVVAGSTDNAIRNAMNGKGDVLLADSKRQEEQFVGSGHGVERFDVMYNDFVLVGPPEDPAEVGGMRDASAALAKIAAVGAVFVSPGDGSGAHARELEL